MRKTFLLGAAACALALTGMGSSPAFGAGPVERGPDKDRVNYEKGTEHANSICAFSGQNDDPEEAYPFGGRVQSYGQLVRLGLKGDFPSPGEVCSLPYTPGAEAP
ncbi:hypothetical protein ACX80L_11525 [Arthrobacter sp. MDT1-48-3]